MIPSTFKDNDNLSNIGIFIKRINRDHILVPPKLLDELKIENLANLIILIQKYDDTRPLIEQYEEELIISNEVLELHEHCSKCDNYHILNEPCKEKKNTRRTKSK